MKEDKNMIKSKLVFEPRAWRALIRKGFNVIDCKPLKTDPTRSILVFEDTPEFQEALAEIMADIKAKDDARKEAIKAE